jgi:chitinase
MPAPLPSVNFRYSFADGLEGQSGWRNLLFAVELSAAATSSVFVTLGTSNGSALAGVDYTARFGVMTFAAGETMKTFAVQVLSDTLNEASETFYVDLMQVTGGAVMGTERTSALGTIVNDDPVTMPVAFLVTNYVDLAEGQTGMRNMAFTIGLTEAPLTTVRVSFATSNGSARAGEDYTARSGIITFLPGETRKTFGVALLPDTVNEADESFYLDLTAVTGGAVLGTDRISALATIVNDDPLTMPTAGFTALYADTTEGHSGIKNMVITVGLSAAALTTVRVGFATANGGARAGEDYTARSGLVNFLPGETRKSFGVAVLGDTGFEGDETFYVELTSITGGAVLDTSRTTVIATIVNDDSPPIAPNAALSDIWP